VKGFEKSAQEDGRDLTGGQNLNEEGNSLKIGKLWGGERGTFFAEKKHQPFEAEFIWAERNLKWRYIRGKQRENWGVPGQ